MRKLDVKEIHGYNATRGIKLIKHSAIPDASAAAGVATAATTRKRK